MSSVKNIIDRFPAIPSTSMGTTITQAAPYTSIKYLDNVGIQVKWTSVDAIGVFSIEASNNYDPILGTGDWNPITFASALVNPASNNGGWVREINQCPHAYIRFVYTRTSGTGTLQVWFNVKEI